MWKLTFIILLALWQTTNILAGDDDEDDDPITEIVVERVDFPMGDASPMVRNIDLRIKKFNRTTSVLDGSVEFLMPVTNEMKYTLDVYFLGSGNKYHLLFSRSQNNLCTYMAISPFRIILRSLYENAGILKFFDKCPRNLGKVTMNNYYAHKDLGQPFLGPISIRENWKASVNFLEGKSLDVIGQIDVYVKIKNQFSD